MVLGSGCAMSPVETLSPRKPETPQLVARAVLPADTLAEGPPSGARVAGGPFASQPVQGFSALLAEGDGGYLTMTDNGYGVAENSADFLLRVYALHPDFLTGALHAELQFTLSDPSHVIPWPIVRHFSAERWLTGADLDPESMVRAPDGTFWFGDEFGPFLVHADAHGALLEAPIPLTLEGEIVRSPDNPFLRRNLMLRSMEALAFHAHHFDAGTPVSSPDEAWLESAEQVKQLHTAGVRVIPWTVKDPARLRELVDAGVDWVISDRPELRAGLGVAGLDVQGHRGARGLAPENTMAAFKAGLDAGATTLELDLTATADGALVVWHDERVGPPKCRGVPDGGLSLPGTRLAALKGVRCDGLLVERFPLQRRGGDTHLLTLAEVLALKVPLNLETKVHGTGAPSDDATAMTRTLAAALRPGDRVTLQSFDWRSLTTAHREFPWLQTVALMGDPGDDASRAGLPWPQVDAGVRVPRSGGFENLALGADGTSLYAMLEKPLEGRELLAFRFSLRTRQFEGVAFRYPLDPRAVAVGDFTLLDATHGYAVERDNTDGALDGFKRLVEFTVPATPGGVVAKRTVVDLLAIPTADGGTFAFPYWTIEGVAASRDGIAIVNDNNYPFGRARSKTQPDATELIVLRRPR